MGSFATTGSVSNDSTASRQRPCGSSSSGASALQPLVITACTPGTSGCPQGCCCHGSWVLQHWGPAGSPVCCGSGTQKQGRGGKVLQPGSQVLHGGASAGSPCFSSFSTWHLCLLQVSHFHVASAAACSPCHPQVTARAFLLPSSSSALIFGQPLGGRWALCSRCRRFLSKWSQVLPQPIPVVLERCPSAALTLFVGLQKEAGFCLLPKEAGTGN